MLRNLVAAWAAMVMAAAHADTVRYDFILNWDNYPSVPSTAGSFTIDSQWIIPNAQYTPSDVLSSFDLSIYDGRTYTLADLQLGWLSFDAAGALQSFGSGDDCTRTACYVKLDNTDSFSVVSHGGTSFWVSALSTTDGYFINGWGPATVTTSPIPEPSQRWLMLSGLAMLIGASLVGSKARTQFERAASFTPSSDRRPRGGHGHVAPTEP